MTSRLTPLLLVALMPAAQAADDPSPILPEVLVTAPAMHHPLTVEADPANPFTSRPPADGADVLRSLPGMAVIRKGGSGGDPLFRGLGVSRLPISADGVFVMGGCGGRMDPPTAYIFPSSFDRVQLIKGPQSVTEGSVPVAGLVRFERDTPRFAEPGARAELGTLAGSHGRHDQNLDVTLGNAWGYLRAQAMRTDQNDYTDGNGARVHSLAQRHSEGLIAGFTPDADTLLEISAERSRAYAAYADRSMDGARFDRDAIGVKFERQRLAPWLARVSASYHYSYVDHVMDNFTLRPAGMMNMLSNPDREIEGGKLQADLDLGAFTAKIGADFQHDRHTSRGTPGYASMPRLNDLLFDNRGVFAEGRYALAPDARLIAGWRLDRIQARDERQGLASSGQQWTRTLSGGFVRGEWDIDDATLYAGLGRAERAPDFWEASRRFTLGNETHTQLDLGANWASGPWEANLSAFASRTRDFILFTSASTVSHVNATRWGGEADVSWRFARRWKLSGSLAYVHGENRSEDRPLAQTPPLEARLNLAYDTGVWGAAVNSRVAARQNRVDVGRGTVAGLDVGPAAGFATVGLSAAWRPLKGVTLSAGVDNLFDKTYAEAVNKGGALVPGYPQTLRVNEPGRSWWLKGQWRL